jgi:hypothetical protein
VFSMDGEDEEGDGEEEDVGKADDDAQEGKEETGDAEKEEVVPESDAGGECFLSYIRR